MRVDSITKRQEVFWSFVLKTPTCWLWAGHRHPDGYGYFSGLFAHRVAYAMTYGAIPRKMFVCHKCDVPWCVRPDHLFLGTPKDNIADMIAKGRQAKYKKRWRHEGVRGEKHPLAKVTDAQVREMRSRHAKGERTSVLAREFGISESHAGDIINRKRWCHVA